MKRALPPISGMPRTTRDAYHLRVAMPEAGTLGVVLLIECQYSRDITDSSNLCTGYPRFHP